MNSVPIGDKTIYYVAPLLIVLAYWSHACGQEVLKMPIDQASRDAVDKAADWLIRHVRRGNLQVNGKETNLSLIAWRDPTLAPDIPDRLAGYAITDTLWASYALTLTHPAVARELHESLKSMRCLRNNLHEVVWEPVDNIYHKPIDEDIVHGRSLGIISATNESVDVRSFTMAADPDFSIGHPLLFLEHAVYQSLYEFRKGRQEAAKNRLRNIFQKKPLSENESIRWDAQRKLLVDFVTKSDYEKFVSGESNSCRQYTFKLAMLWYASRLLGIEKEFQLETAVLQRILQSLAFPDGGIPHFYDVTAPSETIEPCPDATGEATAMFMLAVTICTRH